MKYQEALDKIRLMDGVNEAHSNTEGDHIIMDINLLSVTAENLRAIADILDQVSKDPA